MAAALMWLSVVVASGCTNDEISVRNTPGGAYGRQELETLVRNYAAGKPTPARYLELAEGIEALRPRFNKPVAAAAEKHLVFSALGPMLAVYDEPIADQYAALALTVWPTALGRLPTEGEDADAYGARLCIDDLALECKNVVPEYRATVLAALAWRRLKERAREAYQACSECQKIPAFAEAVSTYHRYERDMAGKVRAIESRSRPSRWPASGEHALPWSGAPLITIAKNGRAAFAGETITPERWQEVLTDLRRESGVVGVYMLPNARVSELRAFMRQAQTAGFAEVALQTRVRDYPYPLTEYRLMTNRRRRNIRVRDVDTIQILVQVLESAASRGAAPAVIGT